MFCSNLGLAFDGGYTPATPLYLDSPVTNTTALVFREFWIDAKLEEQWRRLVRGSNPSVSDRRSGLRIPNVWQVIHSVFTSRTPSRKALPPRIPIVAIVVSEQDRHVLASVSGQELWELYFVESCEEACTVANQLTAPVVLFDRDLPGAEWRKAVKSLAASPHRACVVLMSGVVDDYLRQELIRRGGYEVLPKPLRADNILRVIKLALSYWASTASPGEAKPSVGARRS